MPKNRHYTGLTDAEVVQSRIKNGINVLTPANRESMWIRFLYKFRDPLIIILLVAGLLSIGISCYEYWGLEKNLNVFFEPLGIFMAIILATMLSFIFETKAENEFNILNKVNDDDPVEVYRNGHATQVPRKDIVVGDIVVINTGCEIPADGDLLESVNLEVDESSLTGEPLCSKNADPMQSVHDATFPTNRVLRGTKVMEGHGVMRVTDVGDNTENGKVFEATRIDDGIKTPLDEQLEKLGRLISVASYIIGGMIIAGRIIMYLLNLDFEWIGFLTYLLQSVMIAVTLVVVAVPEGLPMAVTLSLAYSMRRMLRTGNLVRKMHACETMGATTVICTDKTGTLTRNRMQVAETDLYVDSTDMYDLYIGIAVNSTAQLDLKDPDNPTVIGNPTEGALLLWMRSQDIDYTALRDNADIIAQLPFSTERKYMATAVRQPDGSIRIYVKGAPEIIYDICSDFPNGADSDSIDRRLSEYQARAMRTLGFAHGTSAGTADPFTGADIRSSDLRFDGIVAIADPVRTDVPESVKEVTDAGIKIKIVTGDTPGTAKEIGRRIGLWDDRTDDNSAIITGTDFESLSDETLRTRVGALKIIARARPMDKKRLVEALRDNNEIIAVTGDGTNDAPALKAAHIGLSMGDGTAVAKEASDITIVNNSFSSIGRAVMWGRSLYHNIQRFILFQLTVNVAACLIVLAGAFMGTESPLTVTQMLWVNLIMDTFAAMALAALPPDRSVMSDLPRKRSDSIINGSMRRLILTTGGLFFIILFGLLWILSHYSVGSMTELFSFIQAQDGTPALTPYELSLFFTIFVFLQFWNMFNARAWATNRSAFHLGHCGEFVFIAAIIFIGQILIVTTGGTFFNVVPLQLTDWIIIISSTSVVTWISEFSRLISGRSSISTGTSRDVRLPTTVNSRPK